MNLNKTSGGGENDLTTNTSRCIYLCALHVSSNNSNKWITGISIVIVTEANRNIKAALIFDSGVLLHYVHCAQNGGFIIREIDWIKTVNLLINNKLKDTKRVELGDSSV